METPTNRIRYRNNKFAPQVVQDGIGGRWLMTFNDMITLILAIFVLILSMSDMDKPSIDQVSQSVSEAFGIGGIRAPLVPPRTTEPSVDRGQIQVERNAEISKMAIKNCGFTGDGSTGNDRRRAGDDERTGIIRSRF